MSAGERPVWVTAAVFGLVVMIAWTLVVKYLAPLLWSLSRSLSGAPAEASPVMWDFWPVAHLVLAVALWRGVSRAWAIGVAIAAVESAVVIAKFARFLAAPDWSFWKLLWFSNKVYVLLYFVLLVALLLLHRRRDFDDARRPRWAATA